MEYRFGVPVSFQFISIRREKQYLDRAKAVLAEKLNIMYKDLTAYLEKMGRASIDNQISSIFIYGVSSFTDNDFSDVVNEKQPENLFVYLQEYHSYEKLLEKLDLFQSYRNRATELVDDWNFELGK